MDVLGWIAKEWPYLTPLVSTPLAHPKVRRLLRLHLMSRERLVKENMFLAVQLEDATKRADYYESANAEWSKRFDDLDARFTRLGEEARNGSREIQEMRQLSERRVSSIQRLSADRESAILWGRESNSEVIQHGGIPVPEPVWQASPYNALHPEDAGP